MQEGHLTRAFDGNLGDGPALRTGADFAGYRPADPA
jgi:hypothetical protein